jgi:hypothetical protein
MHGSEVGVEVLVSFPTWYFVEPFFSVTLEILRRLPSGEDVAYL